MKKVLLFGALSLVIISVYAQDRLADPRVTYASTITARELQEHLNVLASDDFEGRETGQLGQKMAAKYISTIYKRDGVDHAELPNGYFQSFELVEVNWGNRWVIAGDSLYKFFEDFYAFLGMNKDADINTNEIVFLGYGIDDPEYSDYAGKDVTGKVIVVLDGEPVRKGVSVITGTETMSDWAKDWNKKYKTAASHGVAALLLIDSKFKVRMDNENWRSWIDHGSMELKEDYEDKAALNMLYISRDMATDLLGEKLAAAEKQIQKKGKPRSFVAEKKIQVRIAKLTEDVFSENVAGFVEGSDLKDEIIVVSAHYDHIGVINGEVYNGADDDGSGTVAVMEIAQAMQLARQGGYGPRRSILFLHFAGEEKGLLGSEYHGNHPIFPMEQTVANLNIDMVGRIDDAHAQDTNYVYIIGSDFLSTELHEINEYNAEHYTNLKLDYTYNSTDDPNRFYYRSDHYNFAKFGVPVIFFFNGTHADYHGAGDEVDKISFKLLEQRTRLVFHDVWTLANMDERIVVDVQQED